MPFKNGARAEPAGAGNDSRIERHPNQLEPIDNPPSAAKLARRAHETHGALYRDLTPLLRANASHLTRRIHERLDGDRLPPLRSVEGGRKR
jgi:hypothetical protein